jgi:hypothetical protein
MPVNFEPEGPLVNTAGGLLLNRSCSVERTGDDAQADLRCGFADALRWVGYELHHIRLRPEWNGYDDVRSAITSSVFHSILRATIPARAQSSSAWLVDAPLTPMAPCSSPPRQIGRPPGRLILGAPIAVTRPVLGKG